MREYGHPSAFYDLESCFVSGYHSVNPGLSSVAIEDMTVISLARHIAISQRIPGREHTTEAIMLACEEMLKLPVQEEARSGVCRSHRQV